MASSNIDWICGQCTHKNEGSSEPGPCHICQTPHPKRKGVVVSVPTSVLPANSVCIRQPARSSGSAIDLSAPDAAQTLASASPANPVCIGQPARYSGSVIDLSNIKRFVFFWYLRISRRAMVPGRQWWGFFTPPTDLARLRAAIVARWMRGAFPPVDLRAVCFVLAIVQQLLMLLFYLCFCVCVFCGLVFGSREKREKALWHQISTMTIWTIRSLVLLYTW